MSLPSDLLKWFDRHQRPLPWRRHYRPYEVWVSEIMLQQTQVDTMLPYFRRWFRRFPTIRALAAAKEQGVLKAWQGLGYYSRARNLHRTAKEIVSRHGGRFPEKFEDILALKGVGRYTAGAIASIAFNQERPIVDGNVLRVLSRVYRVETNIDGPAGREGFWELEEKLIPRGKARFFNQALMELGALVCGREPRCADCPIRKHCKSFAAGDAGDFPKRRKRRRAVKVDATALVLWKNGKVLIRRRPEGGIMGGLWEFPEWKLARDRRLSRESVRGRTEEILRKEFGLEAVPTRLGTIKRNYTHHDEALHVFAAAGKDALMPVSGWPHRWTSREEFKKFPFSSAHAKIIELFRG